jgi:hypothetical protein
MAVDENPNEVLKWISKGVQIVTLGFDWTFMNERAVENLNAVRSGSK